MYLWKTVCAMALVFCAGCWKNGEELRNPYYVDPSTIDKKEFKWTFDLKNHDEQEGQQSATNPELMHAKVIVESLDKSVLHMKIFNASGTRYEAPFFNEHPGQNYEPKAMNDIGFSFSNDPFEFELTDPSSQTLFASSKKAGSLEFFDKYIEVGLWFPSNRMFGLGQRNTPDFQLCHSRSECVYTVFNRGAWGILDYGEAPGANQSYGFHPIYLIQLPTSGKFIGVFFHTTNAMDVVIKKHEKGDINVYHKVIGGIVSLYFFYPNSADTVLRKYHDLIGRPYVPPFWSLGYHQSRWGWRTLDRVKYSLARFEQEDIPLEVLWGDIDYMEEYADFTVDPVRYQGLRSFVDDLHRRKIYWVPIVDAGLKYDKENKYIIYGERHHALIMSAKKGKTLLGRVWPGYTAFVDFFSPHGEALWHMGFDDFYKMVKFDGTWIDMNEIVSRCDGECYPDDVSSVPSSDPHDPHEFDNLPYTPGGRFLDYRTVSMTGYHYSNNEDEDRFLKEYNVHSLWSTMEARSIYKYFTKTLKKRPLIITRSSYAGAGQFTSAWQGDNWARWDWMRYSIIYLFNFQIFGMPLNGADVCGYIANATEELCARWMQLGAMTPFSRNHNAHDNEDQEPWIWKKVALASRNAIRQKYSILHYYYTKLFECSLYGGGLINPLFYEFPLDNKAYAARNDTFLIGTKLLVAPVLYPRETQVTVYCPNADWFDLRTRLNLVRYSDKSNTGSTILLDAPFEYINVLVRGGTILPYQDALSSKVRRTSLLHYLPMEILVVPDHEGNAEGSLIVDDGDSVFPIETKNYAHMQFSFSRSKKQMKVKMLQNYKKVHAFERFNTLTIFDGMLAQFSKAVIQGKQGNIGELSGRFNADTNTISFSDKRAIYTWRDIELITFKI